MKITPHSSLNAVVLLVVGLQAQNAFAYLDPGTGSMILQGIVAAVAVAGVTTKHYWYRITGFFGKQGSQERLLDDDDEAETGLEKDADKAD